MPRETSYDFVKLRESIVNALLLLSDDDLVFIYNAYAVDTDHYTIQAMADLDEYCKNWKPSDVILNLSDSFDLNDLWFMETSCQGMLSFDCPKNFVYYDLVAEWLLNSNALELYSDILNIDV